MILRIATCRPLPEPDVDEDLLLEALQSAGIDAQMVAWHDPAEWRRPAATVIRSTWDYIHDLEAFARWATAVAATSAMWNPLKVILGNLHKRYLIELAAHGVPVTPTLLLERGESAAIHAQCAARGWRDVVIKPAVGAGSFETHRIAATSADADAVCRRLLAERDVLVQPYLDSVEHHGERALVWIDGEFTHAVRKSPRFAGGVESVSEALPIAPAERAVGEAALAAVGALGEDLLYARVDVAPDAAGQPVVMELELVEPSLFLLQHPTALRRLVAGIARRLQRLR
jgi:glutathione synthase/RimK-type ligase-like ATP-grasp enzyme